MSGRSIGTAIGFAVGMFFPGVGTALGATLGGMIGGAISPDKIDGVKIGELPIQRSLTGNVQPTVLGTSLVDQCLIMWSSEDRIVEEEEQQGKGGGPVVTNEVLYKDYRIRVCRSSAADGSQVEGFPMIFEDGRLVYDTRPSPRISAADSAKWAENVRFYYGGPTQEPDPTEEAALGVGNASAHRQIASFVKVNQKMTDFGNRVPTYEVVVSKCGMDGGGGGEETSDSLLVTGSATLPGDAMFAAAQATTPLTFVGILPSTGADITGATCGYFGGAWVAAGSNVARISTDNRATWTALPTDRIASGRMAPGPDGWLLSGSGSASAWDLTAKADPITDGFTAYAFSTQYPPGTPHRTHGEETYMCRYAGGFYWMDSGAQGELVKTETLGSTLQLVYKFASDSDAACFHDIEVIDGVVYAACLWNRISPRAQLRRSFDGGATFPDVLIDVATGSGHAPVQLKAGTDGTLLVYCKGASYVWTSADDFSEPHATGIARDVAPNIYIVPYGRQIEFAGGKFYIISGGFIADPTLGDKCVTTTDGLSFSSPVPLAIKGAISIAAAPYINPGYTGEEIPDAPGYYIDPITGEKTGPSLGESTMCGTTLAEVVRYICSRGQLEDSELYLDELDDIVVRGITLQSPGTCKDELDPLRQSHFFDPADFDSKLRFRLRGTVDVDMVINADDLVFTEDDEEQNRILGQEVDLSRKHALNYLSLDLDYLRTPASHEFTTLDPSVVGTSDATINEVFSHDEAMHISAIQHELLRMGNEGYRKFGLPMEYLSLVGGSLVTLNGRRGRIDGQSIDLNAIWFDPVPYDRARAYEANVVAPVLTPPRDPGSTIKGPTDSTLLNIPVLRDTDDKPGIYWAPRGYPDTAWNGAVLQVLRDGQWLQLDSTTNACNTGTLLADLPAYDGVVDETNTLQIRLSGGMDSITFAQFLNEGNPLAIQYDDGKAEILQAQFVTEVTPGVYDCTRLIRGRLDTANGAHVSGAKVVFLNHNLRFIHLRKDDIGKTLSFRAVSNGTDPSVAPVQTITLTTMESQREWQPWNVTVTKLPGCEYLVTCIGRPRLGTDANPIQSQWWLGYRYDFTVDGVTKSHLSQEQSFTYTAAMQAEDWGAVNCAGYIVAVASVNEYTGSDGGGGTGGGTPPAGLPNYPATIIGSPSDGYVGEPIFDALGPQYGAPFQAYGGLIEERFMGEIVGNVTCQSHAPGSGIMVGIPMTAETRNAATEMIPSGPLAIGGPFLITDSVTIAAKPTYSMLDESKPFGEQVLVTPVTVPARTTKRLGSVGRGGLKSRAGTSTAKVRCAFTVSHMPTGGRVFVGVVAAGANDHLAPGTGGSFAHMVTADGIYVVELDGATGAIEVFKIGVGSVATGTLPLTYAYDGKYRFAWVANDAQHAAGGATIHTNMGNESWPDTPTAGYGGLLNAPSIIPCGFDAAVGSAAGYWLQGVSSLTGATRGGIHGGSLVYAYSEFGKSTGKWRIGMSGIETSRLGFCKASHTGLIGSSGSADSIGFTDTRSPAGYIIETSFGGVFNRITVPQFFYYSNPLVYFAFDTDAGTLAIYVKVEVITGDPSATYQLLTTLVGIPAGTWLPAANGIAQLTPEIPEPATFNNWTITR